MPRNYTLRIRGPGDGAYSLTASPGALAVTGSATTLTHTPAGSLSPNEPAGMTTALLDTFNNAWDGAWTVDPSIRTTFVQDATAPMAGVFGHDYVVQHEFVEGAAPGTGAGDQTALNLNANTVYFAQWIKLSSNHPNNNFQKIGYIGQQESGGGNWDENAVMDITNGGNLAIVNQSGTGPEIMEGGATSWGNSPQEDNAAFDPSNDIDLEPGTWHLVEYLITANSSYAASDGVAKVWLDEELISEYDAIPWFTNAGSFSGGPEWDRIKLSSVSNAGGLGSPNGSYYMWRNGVYVSWKN
jgi:hypothetical protein